MLIPKEIFYYNLPIRLRRRLSLSESRNQGGTNKGTVETKFVHWIKDLNNGYDIKVNYITDMKEFKKGNSNFITFDWHRLNDENDGDRFRHTRLVGVLNKELINLINTDVVKFIIDYTKYFEI